MRIKRGNINNKSIFLFIAFWILFLSYSINLWKVATEEHFYRFDDFSEGLVIGKIVRSEKEGIFSYGGLPGFNYDKKSITENIYDEKGNIKDYLHVYIKSYPFQLFYYYKLRDLPPDYITYDSQTGGQAIFYSFIYEVSPFNLSVTFHILKFINAFLVAACFTLFLGWVYRSFGVLSSIVLFTLMFLSPWLTMFGYSLWWSLWTFYLPFLTMLLLLELRYSKRFRISDKAIFIALFAAVFIKCVFTGFEFISTTLLAMFCPIVYYFHLKKLSFGSFFKFSFKAGLVSIFAVLSEMLILITQIRFLKGSFYDGVYHILDAYHRRTEFDRNDAFFSDLTYIDVLDKYFKGNIFEWGFLDSGVVVHFIYMTLAVVVFATIVYCLGKKIDQRKNLSLLLTTLFSILCPLSWFIIFKQHSANHPHLDYIVWYMPFLLYGFLIIGQGVSCILLRIKDKFIK